MQLEFKAGKFSITSWTGQYPMTVTLSSNGNGSCIYNISHSELRDLAYVIDRMRNAVRNALPEACKSEMD